jgi:uncharacterized protein (DUF2147 family)
LFWLTAGNCAFSQPASTGQLDPTGEWLVAQRIARIKIVDCGGHLWGVVAWEARPGTDTKNPDPKLRNRPTLGMPVLLDMAATRPNKWEGNIYNSQNGQTYTASISLSDPNTLRVQGCVLGFLCGGESWTRAETNDTVGRAPAQAPAKPQAGGRKSAQQSGAPADDVCSGILGSAGLTHERGLK